MNFINLSNECLNNFFVIGIMLICKPLLKFMISLASLINPKKKKNLTIFKKYIYNFIKIWAFTMGEGPFSLREFFFFSGGALGLGLGLGLALKKSNFFVKI